MTLEKVNKLPDRIRFKGRTLFLTDDTSLIRRQLESGEDLAHDLERPLMNNISTDEIRELTFALGDLNAPEISPDGSTVVFTRFYNDPERPTSWLINRDGSNPREVSPVRAFDPTWSPDGKQLLFASVLDDLSLPQLFIINIDGSDLRQVSNLPALRGKNL